MIQKNESEILIQKKKITTRRTRFVALLSLHTFSRATPPTYVGQWTVTTTGATASSTSARAPLLPRPPASVSCKHVYCETCRCWSRPLFTECLIVIAVIPITGQIMETVTTLHQYRSQCGKHLAIHVPSTYDKSHRQTRQTHISRR